MDLNKDRSDYKDKNLSLYTRILNKLRGGSKRNLESQRISENNLDSSIFDLIPDGIIIANLTGFIIATNKAYHSLTGYTKDEIVGKHALRIPVLKDIEEVPGYWSYARKIFLGEKLENFEFKYRHADGSIRWGEGRGKISRKGLFKGSVVAVLRDITKRKERELELKLLTADLIASNQELDDYMFAVSHDLKAPLRTIDAFSSILLDDYLDALDDTGKEYLIRMRSATQRMRTLIDDLLTMSRVGRKLTEFEFVNLNKLIGEIEEDYKTLMLEKDSKIILGELPTIETQKIWIKQVFSNLLSNGLKFNNSKNPKIWIKYEEKEDTHLFSVKDNGIGIEKRHEEKIFSLFQRLHTQEEYPGSGAGLTICKKIVESLGGKIWFESEIDKGTTFFFTLLKENTKPENIEDHQNMSDQIKGIHNFQQ